MHRRNFLKYTSLGAVSLAFSSCRAKSPQNTSSQTLDPLTRTAVNFGNLEKTNLVMGFLPVMGATPLIIAQEKGFFAKYGLTVSLRRHTKWSEIETGLKEYRFDAAQTAYTSPLMAQFGDNYAPMICLMVLHRHGSSMVLDYGAWDQSLRPVKDYFNFPEFAKDFRKYIRSGDQPLNYGIDSLNSHNYYLFRYWLSTLGIRTQQEVKLLEIEPPDMVTQLDTSKINGYYNEAPWSQTTINQKQGFSVLVSKKIWTGHPGSIVSTMIPWVENNPHTARALTAAILESCQYCDRAENREEISKILAQSDYLDSESTLINHTLAGNYKYGGFDDQVRAEEIKDFYVFHHQNTDYFSNNDHANYPWLSHGVWFLTQLIRGQSINLREYPKNADHQLKKVYPIDIYTEVAQALQIPIPQARMKIEPANFFIDQRAFDPGDPVQYLRQFAREL